MASRILYIEENEKSAAALKTYFRGTGLSLDRVRDTGEALGHMASGLPDLVLLNLRAPGRPGIEFIQTLRKAPQTSELPVVIMTSHYRGEAYRKVVRKLGVTTYLETPFPMAQLVRAIRNALPAITTAPMPITRHLRRAFLSRFTGIYHLKCMSGPKSLVFFEGSPIHLSPGFFHNDFGRYLRHRNIISTDENSYFSGAGAYRHDTLIQMGCLEYPELLQEKLVYLAEELTAAFGHPPIAVTEQPFRCPPGVQPVAVNVPAIFYQGFQRYADMPQFKRQLAAQGYRYLVRAENFDRFINFLTLSPKEKEFLNRLDGARVLREELAENPDLESLILTLSTLNMIQFSEAPGRQVALPDFPRRALFNDPAQGPFSASEDPLESFIELVDEIGPETQIPVDTSRQQDAELPHPADILQTLEGMGGKNYYEIFGLTPEDCSPSRLRDRYFHYTRKFNPGVLMQLSGETATQAQEILDKVATSYNILSDETKRARYDEILRQKQGESDRLCSDRIEAQVQAGSGLDYLGKKDWDHAEKALQEACTLEPFNGEWMAHLAWSLYRNPSNADSRALRDKARHMLNRALGLERTACGHAYKGWMLLDSGQDLQAREEFDQALALDAQLGLARDGLRSIENRRPSGGRGLFRWLFGTGSSV